MKKNIALVCLSLILLFTALAPACSSGVDKAQFDLAMAELTELREKRAKVQMYSMFLDILMSRFYKEAKLPSRYNFNTDLEWVQAMDNVAATIADPKLTSIITKWKSTPADTFLELENYVIDVIVTTVK